MNTTGHGTHWREGRRQRGVRKLREITTQELEANEKGFLTAFLSFILYFNQSENRISSGRVSCIVYDIMRASVQMMNTPTYCKETHTPGCTWPSSPWFGGVVGWIQAQLHMVSSDFVTHRNMQCTHTWVQKHNEPAASQPLCLPQLPIPQRNTSYSCLCCVCVCVLSLLWYHFPSLSFCLGNNTRREIRVWEDVSVPNSQGKSFSVEPAFCPSLITHLSRLLFLPLSFSH